MKMTAIYLAAAVDTILISSNCSVMTGCHQSDSSMTTSNQQESEKKKNEPIPGQAGYPQGYTVSCCSPRGGGGMGVL